MGTRSVEKPRYKIKVPKNLSPRVQWLRDYYFQGNQIKWNNEFIGRRAALECGGLQVNWVYSCMPPKSMQIYPDVPIEAVREF